MTTKSELVRLPLEALRDIFAFLDAVEIGSLYFCGNTRLKLLIEKSRLVERILCKFIPFGPRYPWPTLVSKLPYLKTLEYYIAPTIERYLPGPLRLEIVPTGLQRLTLSIHGLEFYLRRYLQPEDPQNDPMVLKHLFPSLESLILHNPKRTEPYSIFSRLFIQSLPETLVELRLINIGIRYTSGELSARLRHLQTYCYDSFILEIPTFPPTLTVLKLDRCRNYDSFSTICDLQHLTSLRLNHIARSGQHPEFLSRLPASLIKLKLNLYDVTPKGFIGTLPRNLTKISVIRPTKWHVGEIEGLLPPKLTYLGINSTYDSMLKCPDGYDPLPFLKALPRSLTFLHGTMPFSTTITSDAIVDALPPSLTKLPGIIFDSSLIEMSRLPRGLTDLRLESAFKRSESTDRLVGLPPSLKELEGAVYHPVTCDMPSPITRLTNLFRLKLDTKNMAQLTSIFRSRSGSPSTDTRLEEGTLGPKEIDLHLFLPPMLRRLELEMESDYEETFLTTFNFASSGITENLMYLSIRGTSTFAQERLRVAFDENLRLPNLLQIHISLLLVSQACFESICSWGPSLAHFRISAIDFELTDDHLSRLPRRLRYIYIDGPKCNLTVQGLALLPPKSTECSFPESPKAQDWKLLVESEEEALKLLPNLLVYLSFQNSNGAWHQVTNFKKNSLEFNADSQKLNEILQNPPKSLLS